MHNIIVSRLQSLPPADLHGMYQLRFSMFKKRLDWDVTTDDEEERDSYDGPDAVYILAKAPDGPVDGCWRLLPTMGPYMLRDVFPVLLHGLPAPLSPRIWELSRFAVSTRGSAGATFAFNPLTVQLMAKAVEYAQSRNIERYATVTSVAVERLLKKQGLNIHRIGPPIRIGSVLTVACFIEIDDITSRAVCLRSAGGQLSMV